MNKTILFWGAIKKKKRGEEESLKKSTLNPKGQVVIVLYHKLIDS